MSEMMKCGEQSKYDLLTKALGMILFFNLLNIK